MHPVFKINKVDVLLSMSLKEYFIKNKATISHCHNKAEHIF